MYKSKGLQKQDEFLKKLHDTPMVCPYGCNKETHTFNELSNNGSISEHDFQCPDKCLPLVYQVGFPNAEQFLSTPSK